MTRSTGSAITIWEAGYLIYSYCEVGEIDFNRIKELDLSEGPGFYQWRMDKIDRYLSRGPLYGPASDREKAFWLEKAESVFAVSYLLGCTLLAVLVQGMISGFAELRLPIQLWSNEIPYGVNMGQVCLLWSLMILCIGAALVSIMLFTSALTKSTIDLFADNGTYLGGPYSESLGNGIYELRIKQGSDITRVLYFFWIGRKAILTNGFVKKSQKTPSEAIALAEKYREDYETRH